MAEEIVLAGIVVDAIGALSVVVPDLTTRRRDWIVARTPVVRRWYRLREAFPDHNSKGEYPDDLPGTLTALAPIIEDTDLDLGDVQLSRIEGYRPSGGHHAIFYDGNGTKVASCNLDDLKEAVAERVDRKYRLWGFILLAVGFSLQAVGLLL
jgi:hypothetical protein